MLGNGLIGYTGFVGSTLNKVGRFERRYNSRNIDDIRGQRFNRLVCAGATAAKWIANQNPEDDLASIQRLTSALEQVEAHEFILVSTVDVFSDPIGVLEDTPILENPQAYGRNRFILEQGVQRIFPHAQIIRLPGLFGHGLKKNILFDLIHNNNVEAISMETTFQWYPVARLPADLDIFISTRLPLLHIAPQPLATGALVSRYFADDASRLLGRATISYDMRTNHPSLFGSPLGHYHFSAVQTVDAIGEFLEAFR
jgi:hypothetical protein